jgi:uncharacterized protein (TIGR02246 family)
MKNSAYLATVILLSLGISAAAPLLTAQSNDEAAIKALYDKWNDAFQKKDSNALFALYSPDIFTFDVGTPREYPTWDAYKKDFEVYFKTFPGPLTNTISELHITVVGSVAYSRAVDDATFAAADGSKTRMVVRVTDVLRKSKGKWLIVQEHVSVPVDLATGKPDMLSTP